MPSNSYPLIAKEGWPVLFVLATFYLFCYFYIDKTAAQILLISCGIFAFLFRDPIKRIPSIPLAVVSPVHGKVVSIDTLESPWLERTAQRIRISMSLWDIFSLRSPIEGKIMDQWSKSLPNKRVSREYAYWIKTDEGDDVVTVLHLTRAKWFYRIYLQSGHRIGQGQRCGYLFFGSHVDVYVAEDTKLSVKIGDQIESGASILGHIVHAKQANVIDNVSNIKKKTA